MLKYYNLTKCVRGWSHCQYNTIDITKILEISYRKRLFCIIDKKYPWSLNIEYNEMKVYPTHFMPHYRRFDSGISYTRTITKRYESEKELINEIKNIITNKKCVHNCDHCVINNNILKKE